MSIHACAKTLNTSTESRRSEISCEYFLLDPINPAGNSDDMRKPEQSRCRIGTSRASANSIVTAATLWGGTVNMMMNGET